MKEFIYVAIATVLLAGSYATVFEPEYAVEVFWALYFAAVFAWLDKVGPKSPPPT